MGTTAFLLDLAREILAAYVDPFLAKTKTATCRMADKPASDFSFTDAWANSMGPENNPSASPAALDAVVPCP